MDWYWNLASLLLRENTVDGASAGLRQELEKRLACWYKALFSYQMMSVCSYYYNRGPDCLRSVVQLDGWDGSLTKIHDAESAV